MRVAGVEADAAGQDLDMVPLGAARRLVDDPTGPVGRAGQGRLGFGHVLREAL